MTTSCKPNTLYLIREALLIVVGSYLLFFGGTYNGLVHPQIIWTTLGLVGGVSLIWILACFRRRRWIETPVLWLPLLAVALASSVTGFTSLDTRRSLDALWVLSLEIWVFLLVHDLVRRGWPAELFVKVLLLLGAIFVAFTLWQLVDWELQWLAIAGWRSPFPPVWLRPGPFYSHGNLTAAFVNLLWPPALAWWKEARSRLTRLGCSVLIAGCAIALLFSSSRGGLLAAAGACLLMWILAAGGLWPMWGWFRTHLLRSRWQTALAGLIALISSVVVFALAVRILKHPGHGPFWTSRSMFWQVTWQTFRASPLVGSGPGTFASDFMRWQSVPPVLLYTHANSLPMQVLSESGLIGLGAGAYLVLALIVAAYRRWRAAPPARRGWIAGLCSAIAAVGFHSAVETPTHVPAIAIGLLALIALLLAEPAGRSPHAAGTPVGTAMALLAALLVTVSGAWAQWAYRPYYLGAAWGNVSAWETAVPFLEEATRRDPGHAYYHLQAGFAYGMAAQENPALLPQAIEHYRQGIAREPYYSLNHANLAVLLWQYGDREAAIVEMTRAAELAPAEAAYPLNLGVFYEAEGKPEHAVGPYQRALTLRPDWAAAYFWRASAVRQAALEAWQAGRPVEPAAPADEEALAQFTQAIRENPADPALYLGQARALIGLGRWEEAAHALRVADFCARGYGATLSAHTPNDIAYYGALVAYQQGHRSQAIEALERALEEVRGQSVFGPGGSGAMLYGWGVFHRVGWGWDALPGLQVIRFTDEQVNRLLLLGQWYEEAGDAVAARRVYHEALEVAPDTTQAAERLAALEGQ